MGRPKTARRLESEFQADLIDELRRRFPGCWIQKNDEQYRQGIPDLLILWRKHWAMLEVKAYEGAPEQPNQRYYVEEFNRTVGGFSTFIYPENAEAILNEMERAFRP